MSISELSAYYAGREPYLKYPNENRDITLSGATSVSALTATGPVNINSTLDVTGTSDFFGLVSATAGVNVTNGLTVDSCNVNNDIMCYGALTVNQPSNFNAPVLMAQGLQIMNYNSSNDYNVISSDAGGSLLIRSSHQCVLPTVADDTLSGLAIAWNIATASGSTDLINLAQAGTGGFTFRSFNAGGIYQSLLSVVPNTLPVFTYGPVAYGHMIATGSLAFAYPSSTTASINTASGIYAYMINVPGPWTTTQASNATIMTTICNTNVGLGAVTCAVIAMPTMLNGYLTFQIQVINASHQAQECDFYYTVNAGNY